MKSISDAAAELGTNPSRLRRLLKRDENAGLVQHVAQGNRSIARLSPGAIQTLRAQIETPTGAPDAPRTERASMQKPPGTYRAILIEGEGDFDGFQAMLSAFIRTRNLDSSP